MDSYEIRLQALKLTQEGAFQCGLTTTDEILERAHRYQDFILGIKFAAPVKKVRRK